MNDKKWEYKGLYHKYDMTNIINLPNNSKLKVCDLTLELPDFMLEADTIFIDPPCNIGNLRTFFTKNDMQLNYEFDFFYRTLFNQIDIIKPKHLFIEVFKSNKEIFINECKLRYKNIIIYDSMYYKKSTNKCWIIHCSNEDINYIDAINNIDEELFIKWICTNHTYNCIGDLCMGTGLVGKYAFLNNKQFVGTELNKKRLAILVDFITIFDLKTYKKNTLTI